MRKARVRGLLPAGLVGLVVVVPLACGGTDRTAALPTASLPEPAGTAAAVRPVTSAASMAEDMPGDPSGSAAMSPTGIAVEVGEPGTAPAAAPATTAPAAATIPPPEPGDAPVTAAPAPPAAGEGVDVRPADKYAFTCSDDEATVAASGAARVTLGAATVYAGTQQVTGDNQDPRVARFDGGVRSWCRDDLERTDDDGRAYGLLWSGDLLYVAFTATGTQGDDVDDLRRFTRQGWLRSYSDASPGGGGGPKVSAVVRLDPATGDGISGSWLTALNNGRTNSLVVTSLQADAAGLTVTADSWFAPRAADRTAMTCTGGSPFAATYRFSPDLTTVTSATADRCSAG